jgi:hypothetical protein
VLSTLSPEDGNITVSETFSVDYQLMDKLQKLCNPEYYTPSSELFRTDLYSVVGGYQHFGQTYCLHLQDQMCRTGICKQFAGKVVTQVRRRGRQGGGHFRPIEQ